LLVSEGFEELVYHYQLNARRANRSQSFGTLLGSVNREGLVAKPILRDFVAVYYDPNSPPARDFDSDFLDLKDMRRVRDVTGRELIPLGIYGIGQARTRVNAIDFTSEDKLRNRKIFRFLADLGGDAGAIFVPFPFSILVKAGKQGIGFVLNKGGRSSLEDMLKTEAELAALIDSGLAAVDPTFLDTVRNQLDHQNTNIFRAREMESRAHQQVNVTKMHEYLERTPEDLCQEVREKREKDFRGQYLSLGENITRVLHSILAGISKEVETELVQKRTQIIRERQASW
jgi:hypothetical protein